MALSIMLCAFCTNMAAAFALAVVQDTLEHLDSYQDGDYSGILLRLEYLNRIIINFGDLPDSIVAGIGSAITCLSSAQRSSVPCTYRAERERESAGKVLSSSWWIEDPSITRFKLAGPNPALESAVRVPSEEGGLSSRGFPRQKNLMLHVGFFFLAGSFLFQHESFSLYN